MLHINKLADFILATSQEVGDCITNLKLQKLAYYSEAWHLAIKDRPLTGARFEAWVHGPVNPDLYHRFSSWGAQPLIEPVTKPKLNRENLEFMEEVLDAYSRFSAWDLERMTHAEEPWIKARGGLPPDAPSNAVIDQQIMREFYRSRAKSA